MRLVLIHPLGLGVDHPVTGTSDQIVEHILALGFDEVRCPYV